MIPTTILDAMWKAKQALGHTDRSKMPQFICPVCNQLKATTWHEVDKERGFWTDETACITCEERNEAEQVKVSLRKRFDRSGIPPIHQIYTLRSKEQPCGRIPLPSVASQQQATDPSNGKLKQACLGKLTLLQIRATQPGSKLCKLLLRLQCLCLMI